MAIRGVKAEANPTALSYFLSMRSIKNRQSKPVANIPLSFNDLGRFGGAISRKNELIEAAYRQH